MQTACCTGGSCHYAHSLLYRWILSLYTQPAVQVDLVTIHTTCCTGRSCLLIMHTTCCTCISSLCIQLAVYLDLVTMNTICSTGRSCLVTMHTTRCTRRSCHYRYNPLYTLILSLCIQPTLQVDLVTTYMHINTLGSYKNTCTPGPLSLCIQPAVHVDLVTMCIQLLYTSILSCCTTCCTCGSCHYAHNL